MMVYTVLNLGEKSKLSKGACGMKIVIIFIVIFQFASIAFAITLTKDEVASIPSTGAKVLKTKSGNIYLVAACIQERMSGVPISHTLEMASVQARASLSQYLNGEEFVKDIQTRRDTTIFSQGGGVTTGHDYTRIISQMRGALKRVEVISEDTSNPALVKVVVGVPAPQLAPYVAE